MVPCSWYYNLICRSQYTLPQCAIKYYMVPIHWLNICLHPVEKVAKNELVYASTHLR